MPAVLVGNNTILGKNGSKRQFFSKPRNGAVTIVAGEWGKTTLLKIKTNSVEPGVEVVV